MEKDLYVRHEFPACLTRESGTEEVFVSIQYHEYDPSLLEISVHLFGNENQKEDISSRFRNHRWNFFRLYHPHEPSKSVEVLGITGMTYGPELVSPRASAIQFDISDAALTEERKYDVTAQLTPSGILFQPRIVHYSIELPEKSRTNQLSMEKSRLRLRSVLCERRNNIRVMKNSRMATLSDLLFNGLRFTVRLRFRQEYLSWIIIRSSAPYSLTFATSCRFATVSPLPTMRLLTVK
jgi:hypothetical protein